MEPQINQPSTAPAVDKTVKGPKALFWYLTLFFTLAVTAFNTGGLWFQYINKWFPQEVAYGVVRQAFQQEALKFALASLLIATPLFFLFSWLIRKALKNSQLNSQNKIRVWTTYIILFLTIAIAVGDLITTVFRVLGGDYTLRFLLKSLTILIIVAWIFIYYGLELRSANSLIGSKIPKTMTIITIVVIAISFIGAFFVIDSPALARIKAYDQTRENDLRNIMYTIDDYYSREGELPASLADLPVKERRFLDPKTSEEYAYRVISDEEYELCATFETSNEQDYDYYPVPYDYEFIHDIGEKCFPLKVRTDQSPEGRVIPQPDSID